MHMGAKAHLSHLLYWQGKEKKKKPMVNVMIQGMLGSFSLRCLPDAEAERHAVVADTVG